MKANELRIGNYVKFKSTDDIERVYNIANDFKWSGNKEKQFKTTPDINDVDINDVIPIPLTEEWRLRAGFKDDLLKINDFDNELEWRERTKEIVIWGSDGSTDGHNFRVKCEYVHKFQNLYFVLTNQELEITG